MAEQASELIAQLQAQVLALQEAATAESLAVADAAEAAALAATTATNAAVQQATADAAQPRAVAPGGPVWTLAPALANTTTFLDLTSSSGAKHFKSGIEPLNSQPFDFEDGADLQVFLDLVLAKSQVYGWNAIFTIPVKNAMTGVIVRWNILNHYGMVPLASVRAHVLTYYSAHTKQAQDAFMLCQCLLNSLSLDFLKTITANTDAYHLPAIVDLDGSIPSGPLLLKLIISRAHVDTRATVSFLRSSLTLLDEKMVSLDSNILLFNAYVRAQVKALTQRNEVTPDLFVNLMKGYKKAQDSEFLDLIRRVNNEYEEGQDIDINTLMDSTDNKYRTRLLTKEWAAPTKEQAQIVALTAQLEHFTSAKGPKQLKKSTAKKTKKDNKWAWKDTLPKDGEPTTKLFDGKQYHVNCPFHKDQWVCHTLAECLKNPANATAEDTPAASVPAATPGARRLQLAQLASALLADDANADADDAEDDADL
jgi:hypothetical protein